jgi:hypothetical protein
MNEAFADRQFERDRRDNTQSSIPVAAGQPSSGARPGLRRLLTASGKSSASIRSSLSDRVKKTLAQ